MCALHFTLVPSTSSFRLSVRLIFLFPFVGTPGNRDTRLDVRLTTWSSNRVMVILSCRCIFGLSTSMVTVYPANFSIPQEHRFSMEKILSLYGMQRRSSLRRRSDEHIVSMLMIENFVRKGRSVLIWMNVLQLGSGRQVFQLGSCTGRSINNNNASRLDAAATKCNL